MDGLFLENGPFKLDDQLSLHLNPHSWHHLADVLYIDQPVGTGLSFTTNHDGYPRNDEQVNAHLYYFLQEFLKLHSDYVIDGKTSCDIYLAGESHAGHYIPAFAMYALRRANQQQQQSTSAAGEIKLTLAGLAIGNGWISPDVQYDVSDFAHSLGLISYEQRETLKGHEHQCQASLARGIYSSSVCFSLLDNVVAASTAASGHRVNMYDIRQYLPDSEAFPPGHQRVEKFMNQASVKQALHASHDVQRFVECADPPYHALKHQDGKGVTKELAMLLDAGVRVLLFAGQYDLIVNHMGISKLLRSLEWKGKEGYSAAANGVFMMKKVPAGYIKEYENLAFVVISGAGHMVPMDKPAESLELMRRFLERLPLNDGQQRIKASPSASDRVLACIGEPLMSELPPAIIHGRPAPTNGGALLQITAPRAGIKLEVAVTSAHSGTKTAVYTVTNTTALYTLDGLVDGETYEASVTVIDAAGLRTQPQRSPPFVPGCIAPTSSLQCCGHGLCGLGSAQQTAQCFCDAEYAGEFCQIRRSDQTFQCDAAPAREPAFRPVVQQQPPIATTGVFVDECTATIEGDYEVCDVVVTLSLRSPLLASRWNDYVAATEAMLVTDIRSMLAASSVSSMVDTQQVRASLWKNSTVTSTTATAAAHAVVAQVTFRAKPRAARLIGQELSQHSHSSRSLLASGVVTSWLDPSVGVHVAVRPSRHDLESIHDSSETYRASSLNLVILLVSPLVLLFLVWQFRKLRRRTGLGGV